jgi:hypothetical protein
LKEQRGREAMNFHTVYEISRRTAMLLITLGLILVGVNLLLILQNKQMKAFAAKRDRLLGLQQESVLPALSGNDIHGDRISIDYGQDPRKTLLLVMSPTCSACDENMANWEEIVAKIDRNSYRVVVTSLTSSGLAEHLSPYSLPGVPVLAELDANSKREYGLALTPQTALISPEGRVENVWTGVLHTREMREVGAALNLMIP